MIKENKHISYNLRYDSVGGKMDEYVKKKIGDSVHTKKIEESDHKTSKK